MAKPRLSEAARVDLEEIRSAGVERFGDQVAERHLPGIRRVFEMLAEHPFAGPKRPEFQARDIAAALRGES